jgi:hypothetical protein
VDKEKKKLMKEYSIEDLKEFDNPNERGCYCSLWIDSPSTLIEQGVPEGYCGLCEKCGEPGHLRHFPGAVPYTGSWCDKHYRRVAMLHPLGSRSLLMIIILLSVISYWVNKLIL